jgi:hypothetical protein
VEPYQSKRLPPRLPLIALNEFPSALFEFFAGGQAPILWSCLQTQESRPERRLFWQRLLFS